ncbi:MAG TPA: GntR family transcriptional regulator [Planctomycetota bacterium]|nr:GntR family transcriptional regulator [Planctomycetota bacterium]
MVVTRRADGSVLEAIGYVELAGKLRQSILNGEIGVGEILPSNKQLAATHGVAPETARRAAKQLEAEGLVASEPRQGFRVLARVNDPERGLPIAFVLGGAEKTELWDDFSRMLFACLQQAAADRGWSMLAIGIGGRSPAQIMEQLRDCRACGMVLDVAKPELLAEVGRVRLPAVMMDAWSPEMSLDAVVQDSFQGAMAATKHLLACGHRRIAWLGRISESVQSQERYGGVAAALAAAGVEFRPEYMRDTPWPETPAAARRLLSLGERPTAVLGLWHDAAAELAAAAGELGLSLGRDLELVGWCTEELYGGAYSASFRGSVPPTMVWSIAELARLTIVRLAERRARPEMPPTLIKVPVRLRPAEKGKS